MNNVAVAILAAGRGSRMNGEIKQLVSFGEENLINRAVRTAQRSNVGDVFLILGYLCDEIEEAVLGTSQASVLPRTSECTRTSEHSIVPRTSQLSIVRNHEWQEGIASSIRAAVTAVEKYDAVIFMTVDQPFVDEEWLAKIKNSFVDTRREVVASNYGKPRLPGIPALFAKSKFSALSMLKGDRGAKQIIVEADPVLLDSAVANYDIDTTDDLEECLNIRNCVMESQC